MRLPVLKMLASLRLTVSLLGCRMANYAASEPITVENPNAIIQAEACVDRDENPYRRRPEVVN